MLTVAYGPDGTLYALTVRSSELWAYPPGGASRVLVARRTDNNRLEGWLDVSPDGRWLSVSGVQDPTLFKVGSFTPDARNAPTKGCAFLPGWEDYRFPELRFYHRTCFTGDSAFWFGRTHDNTSSIRTQYHFWSLPDLAQSEYKGFSDYKNIQNMAAVPGESEMVIEGWSAAHKAVGYWRGDLAQPEVKVTEPVGTTEHCNGFVIGSDGRYYVSYHGMVLIYSLRKKGFHLDLSVKLPHYTNSPKISLCADARRFVTHAFRSKLVCAVDTRSGEVLGPWDWEIGQVHDAAIAPDGLTAAAGGSSKKLIVWDLEG